VLEAGSSGREIEYNGGRRTRYIKDFHGNSRQDISALLASKHRPLAVVGTRNGS
jgi:hypothetical protein